MSKFKKIIYTLFQLTPISNIIMLFNYKVLNVIKWTFKLYLISSIIPISLTIMNSFSLMLGYINWYDFLISLKPIWYGYYINGFFLNVIAWRWHLIMLFISFLITISNEYD